MANVKIVGDAAVLTSEIKLDDIKLVEKTNPRALSLFGEEDGHEVALFTVGASKTAGFQGCVTKAGITFGKASRDGGYAQITFPVPEGDGDPKELVADKIGVALMNLNKIEGCLPDVIDDINAAKATMLDCIEVC